MNPPEYSEFERNQQGFITKSQQNDLIGSLVTWSLFWTVFGGLFVAATRQEQASWTFTIVTILVWVIGYKFIIDRCIELLRLPAPKYCVGGIRKYIWRGRRLVKIQNGLTLAANKRLYHELHDGDKYEIYYTQKSKWLLSYRRIEEPNDASS